MQITQDRGEVPSQAEILSGFSGAEAGAQDFSQFYSPDNSVQDFIISSCLMISNNKSQIISVEK